MSDHAAARALTIHERVRVGDLLGKLLSGELNYIDEAAAQLLCQPDAADALEAYVQFNDASAANMKVAHAEIERLKASNAELVSALKGMRVIPRAWMPKRITFKEWESAWEARDAALQSAEAKP